MGRVDVVIIGAGVSGLTAARKIRAAGRSVCVLEARDRVGGRTLTRDFNGTTVDLGGQWLGPTQKRALALARELDLDLYPQFDSGRKVMHIGGKVRTYRGLIPWVGLRGIGQLARRVARIEYEARRIPLDDPASAALAERWDRRSVADFFDEHVTDPNARAILDIATRMIYAADPRDISLLFFLFYMHSGGGFIRLASTRGGAQAERIVGGAQQISERLSEQLPDVVRLEAPVAAMQDDGKRVFVQFAGGEVEATSAILAVPPQQARRIERTPEPPPQRRDLEASMKMGSVCKFVVFYERPFWREAGVSGEAISDASPVRATFDACPHDGSYAALVGFCIPGDADALGITDEDTRREAVLDHLAEMFGPAARAATAYVDHDWSTEAFSGGCYTGLLAPGAVRRTAAALRPSLGRFHHAGTETATRWCGYIDGAIESGDRAADEVLARR